MHFRNSFTLTTIILGATFIDANSISHPHTSRESLVKNRARRSLFNRVWPNGVIPYAFDADFTQDGRNNFQKTILKLAQRTCVRFKPKDSNDRQWLRMINDNACGTIGGMEYPAPDDPNYKGQPLTMGPGCTEVQYFEHELGHVMGLPHEQDRPDRDDYIRWDPSKPECNGAQQGADTAKLEQAALDIMYDYVSIMHDWKECIWPKLPGPITIGASGPGETNTWSVLDYEKFNAIFDCGGCQSYRFRKIELLSYYQHPVVGGNDLDRQTLYICRTYHEGSILIGKSKPDEDKCFIGADDRENEYKVKFEVLTNPKKVNINWVKRPDDFSIPQNAILGGRTVTRKPVYIGRCLIAVDNARLWTPGTLYKGDRELKVPFGGGLRSCTDYEILVCN